MKKRSFFQSLRGKVTLQMLIVSLIPILIVGGLVWNSMSSAEDKASDSVDESRIQLHSDIGAARDQLNSDITEARAVLEKDTVGAALSTRAWALVRELESWMGARILSIESYAGAPVVLAAAQSADMESAQAGAANSFLAYQLGLTPYIALATVADANGKAVAGGWAQAQPDGTTIPVPGIPPQMMAPPPNGIGGNVAYMPSYQALMASGYDTYVSDIYWVQPAGMYFIDIAVKIRDADGNVAGVVVGSTIMWPSTMGPAYRGMYPDPNVRILFYSRDGNVMCDTGEWVMTQTGPAPAQVDANGMPVQRWLDNSTGAPVPVDQIKFTPAEEAVRKIIFEAKQDLIPATSFVSYEDNILVAYARGANSLLYFGEQTAGFSGTGYSVVILQPTSVAFAAIDKVDPEKIVGKIDADKILSSLDGLKTDLKDNTSNMMVTLIIVLAAVFFVILLVAFYLSRGITKPIAHLATISEKVSMGEMDVKVEVKSNDEIGDLADSFGRMIATVKFLSSEEDTEKK